MNKCETKSKSLFFMQKTYHVIYLSTRLTELYNVAL